MGVYSIRTMKLYVLRWNPLISSFKDEHFRSFLGRLGRRGCPGLDMDWSIYEPEQLEVGDWFIFCRVGTEHDGIVGLGTFSSVPYPGGSWRRDGKIIMYADMQFLLLQENRDTGLWTAEALEKEFPEIGWHGGHAGVPLSPEVSERLAIWLARDIAGMPVENISSLASCREEGGRFGMVCAMLSRLCPELLSHAEETQEPRDAMEEDFMPQFGDELSVDWARWKDGSDPKECVRLLKWEDILPCDPSGIVNLLFAKKRLSLKSKFQQLRHFEEKFDGELSDYYEKTRNASRFALLVKDFKKTLAFFQEECDGETLVDTRGTWDRLAKAYPHWELIEAIALCMRRYPEESEKYNLRDYLEGAIVMLPREEWGWLEYDEEDDERQSKD